MTKFINKMDINLLIKTLLLKNKGVIVPGFGGFTLESTKARIDEVKRIAYPPEKHIRFDPSIKIDDNKKLEKLILEKDKKKGAKSLDIFVDQLNDSLDKKVAVLIEGFGTIQKKDNRYTFIPDKEFSELLNPHQPIALPAKEKETPPVIEKKETKTIFREKSTPPPSPSEKKSKSNTGLLVLASIVILLSIGTILTIFLTEPEIKTPLPLPEKPTAYSETEKEDEDPYAKFTKFSLVTGSYLSERNAIQHQEELSREGFSGSRIVQHDSLFRVCIKSFDKREIALQHLTKIRNKKGESFVWLLSHN